MKLTFREKYSYGIGAFGKDLVYAFVATYLMMFFTDEVGISSVCRRTVLCIEILGCN